MIENIKASLDSQSKVLIKNSGWVFFSNFFSTGLAFIRSVVIARGLGPGIYGTYAIIVAFVGLVQEFLNLNTGTALIKFGADYHVQGRNDKLMALVKSSLLISFVMALLSIVIIAIITLTSYSTIVNQPHLEWFIILYAIAASITYMNSISRGLLRLYYKFKLSSVIQMIMDVVETVAITIAVLIYPKNLNVFFTAIILTRFLNGFICNLLAYFELRKELGPYLNVATDLIHEDRKSFRDFVVGNSLGNSLKTAISQGDVLLLGWLTNVTQVGLYSVSKKLAYSVLTLTDPLTQSIYPQLSKLLAEKKFPEVRKMLIKITSLAMIPGIIFMVLTFFLDHWIVRTIYGKAYIGAGDSFFYFVVGAVFGAATFWTLPLVQSMGLVRMRLKAYVLTIVLGSFLAWWWVPLYQSAGMAMALLVTNLSNMTIFITIAFRRMRQKEISSLTV